MVESQPSKLLVASSILVSRSMFSITCKTSNFGSTHLMGASQPLTDLKNTLP